MKKETLAKWIAVVALGIATLYVYHPRLRNSGIHLGNFESFNLAQALVEHRGFSDPFEPMRTGPSAHLAPLYPAYLAAIMSVTGSAALSANVLVWSAALMLTAQLMLFPHWRNRLGSASGRDWFRRWYGLRREFLPSFCGSPRWPRWWWWGLSFSSASRLA